jgi:hypothetical protein
MSSGATRRDRTGDLLIYESGFWLFGWCWLGLAILAKHPLNEQLAKLASPTEHG